MRGEENGMADDAEVRLAQTPASEQEIRSRVDGLLAEMTTAEKAGQLTQYFHFGVQRDIATDSDPGPAELRYWNAATRDWVIDAPCSTSGSAATAPRSSRRR